MPCLAAYIKNSAVLSNVSSDSRSDCSTVSPTVLQSPLDRCSLAEVQRWYRRWQWTILTCVVAIHLHGIPKGYYYCLSVYMTVLYAHVQYIWVWLYYENLKPLRVHLQNRKIPQSKRVRSTIAQCWFLSPVCDVFLGPHPITCRVSWWKMGKVAKKNPKK